MLPDGHFRQGFGCTGRAIGRNHQRVSRIVSTLLAPGVKPLQGNESQAFPQEKPPRRPAFGVFNLAGKLLKSIAAQGISLAALEGFKQQRRIARQSPWCPAGLVLPPWLAPGALLA